MLSYYVELPLGSVDRDTTSLSESEGVDATGGRALGMPRVFVFCYKGVLDAQGQTEIDDCSESMYRPS